MIWAKKGARRVLASEYAQGGRMPTPMQVELAPGERIVQPHRPLSVRVGGWVTRLVWWWKGQRELAELRGDIQDVMGKPWRRR